MAMAKPDPTDKLLEGRSPEDILGENGLLDDLTKRPVERALEGEMTHHLGYAPRSPTGQHTGNSRNGKTHMMVFKKRRRFSLRYTGRSGEG